MTMRIVAAEPPLIDEIDSVFDVRGKPVLFAWGDRIYNPHDAKVTPELMAHEAVHGRRQLNGLPGGTEAGEFAVRAWWRRYLAEPEFVLAEEKPAHLAEFEALCAANRAGWHSLRNMRRTYAAYVARRLAAPLYGRLISIDEAKRFILESAREQAA